MSLATLTSTDILQKAINRNVHQAEAKVIETHTRKLEKLTRNTVLPFTANKTVTNISSYCLTSEQLDILKFGLSHSICPPSISKTDVFTCFELIHRTMTKKLIDKKHDAKLVADLSHLSHLSHSYVSAHWPTTADRKKYRILKDLKKKQTIVILKPDKGNGVVVLDRIAYDNGILKHGAILYNEAEVFSLSILITNLNRWPMLPFDWLIHSSLILASCELPQDFAAKIQSTFYERNQF